MRFLLDTNVISEAISPGADRKVLHWLTQNSVASTVSVVSIGEIWQGIEMLPKGKRKDSYVGRFDSVESDLFGRPHNKPIGKVTLLYLQS